MQPRSRPPGRPSVLAWMLASGHCPALPSPALPCPALPCPALPCPALLCPALPCPALPCPALPCPACPALLLPCPALLPCLRLACSHLELQGVCEFMQEGMERTKKLPDSKRAKTIMLTCDVARSSLSHQEQMDMQVMETLLASPEKV